jgi:LAS superfamily LD-carboxypeptidase LdcB
MPTGRVPGRLGHSATSGVVTTTAASLGRAPEGRSREQFKEAVLQGQIRRRQNQGKTYFPAVPESELAEVESGFRMRRAAAQSCKDILTAARAALEAAKQAGDAAARRTTAIGVCSAYRDYGEDATAWVNTFNKHYDKEGNRSRMEGMPGGRHGDVALQWFVDLMAPPGFSNHSKGLAVDFSTTESGETYGADTGKHVEWQRTWLHPWLVANAKTYRFHPLSSEEWHWDWA